MDLKQIKELMTAMEKAGIKKVKLKEEKGFELELERQDEPAMVAQTLSAPSYSKPEMHAHFPPPHSAAARHPMEEERNAKEKKSEDAPGKYVTSPMVGTFYASPSPDDPPFVKVGDRVEEDTIVCIIEAMKVMNEVKAGVKGVVAEILLSNANPVEFGTKLLRIV